jgi:hypothetical protein
MLKKFIASVIARELDSLHDKIADIERGINSSLADIRNDMDDIRNNVDEIDAYNLASSIADHINIDEERIAREISSYTEQDNSDNWNELWHHLTKIEKRIEDRLDGIVKVLQPQLNEN